MFDPAAMDVDPSALVTAFSGNFVFARGSDPELLTKERVPSEFLITVRDGGSLLPSTLYVPSGFLSTFAPTAMLPKGWKRS